MSERPKPPLDRQQKTDGSSYAPIGDLRAYVGIVRRRKWSLILVVALTVASAAFFSNRQTPMYQSSSTVLVKPLNPNQILQGYSYSFSVSMQTEQALATSPAVAAIAATNAEALGATGGDVGTVTTKVPTDTTFLQIGYSSPDPSEAQIWSQSYANAYMEYRREQAKALYDAAQAGFQKKIEEVGAQISALESEILTAPPAQIDKLESEKKTLQSSLNDLTRQSGTFPFPVADTAAQLISPATLPNAPYSPNWTRNLIMALLAGLALGFAVVFIRERLDDRLVGREDLEDASGAPVLAIVPKVAGWGKKNSTKLVARDAPKSASSEAYRTLRTNVGFMARTNELKLISIASPSMGEGKTTTTANLAIALAQTGKRVIVVSCDLRKPRLHRFFGLTNDIGVTSVLRDGRSVPEVAQQIPGMNNLRVIASGPIPHNPAELLGSPEMEVLLQDLRRFADYVLIDTAPVLVVSDALSLAPKTDGVLLVVDASTTMRGAVRATKEQLELVGSNIVGAVFNNFDPSRAKMYYGSYRYHFYSAYEYKEGKGRADELAQPLKIDPNELWK
jgi:capsular exopolysaccharide synthesis family protein